MIDRLRSGRGPQIVAIWLSLLAFSLSRAPIPAVNEPHYLAKARHYWQPEWCRGDLFLESSNPHLVFYQTIGWLTSVCSLETAALVGRIIALFLLAVGWSRLVSQLLTGKWAALGACWLFLLLQSLTNFAGEWLVGGVESKVVAYALVMWASGEMLRGRLLLGGALLGCAISFHPVVGAWSLLCLIGADVGCAFFSRHRTGITDRSANHQSLRRVLPAISLGAVCSLPGLIPAVSILASANPEMDLYADKIQVAIRLDHHLDPAKFRWSAYVTYGLMLAAWRILRRMTSVDTARRRLDAFTWMTVAVAVGGLIAAAGPRPLSELPLLAWRLKILKLYPFRIADLVVPFTLSVAVTQFVATRIATSTAGSRRALFACGFATIFAASLLVPTIDRNPSRMSPQAKSDWIAALHWIERESPPDSLLWTPDEDWAVKWFAERPEYVNFKDCPQDTNGIIEWYRRRVLLAKWKQAAARDGDFALSELHELHKETGITHIVVSRMGPIDAEPVFRNDTFRVYGLRGLPGQ